MISTHRRLGCGVNNFILRTLKDWKSPVDIFGFNRQETPTCHVLFLMTL